MRFCEYIYSYDALGQTYYPLTDIQGTVWGYVDSDNSVVARWTYDAWGNVLDESVSVPALATLRYRFQGREWSAATGLVNFRMRWYDSDTGRWLSKDPIGLGGGLNLYAFCSENPICYLDHYGMCQSTPDFSGRLLNDSPYILWAKPEEGVDPIMVKPGDFISGIDGFVIPDIAPGKVYKVPNLADVKVDQKGFARPMDEISFIIVLFRGGWKDASFARHEDWRPVMRKAPGKK